MEDSQLKVTSKEESSVIISMIDELNSNEVEDKYSVLVDSVTQILLSHWLMELKS